LIILHFSAIRQKITASWKVQCGQNFKSAEASTWYFDAMSRGSPECRRSFIFENMKTKKINKKLRKVFQNEF